MTVENWFPKNFVEYWIMGMKVFSEIAAKYDILNLNIYDVISSVDLTCYKGYISH